MSGCERGVNGWAEPPHQGRRSVPSRAAVSAPIEGRERMRLEAGFEVAVSARQHAALEPWSFASAAHQPRLQAQDIPLFVPDSNRLQGRSGTTGGPPARPSSPASCHQNQHAARCMFLPIG